MYRALIILAIVTFFTGCDNSDKTPTYDFYINYVPQWQVDNSKYEHSMQIICSLKYDNYIFEDPGDMVAAFINGECTGYAKPVNSKEGVQNIFLLTVFGDSANDKISFKMYDANKSRLIEADNIIEFIPSGIVGSVSDPLDIFKSDNN